MSVFSALDTAVSGLTAQSVAFSNISNNIANSQTVGYKAVDTSFADYLGSTGALEGQSGSVMASTQYNNQVAGAVTSSSADAALAVNGNGFFLVSEVSGASSTNAPTFSGTQYYTRAGDFQSNKDGYLVNSAGEYLDGYAVNPTTGQLNTSALQPINVNNVKYNPTATTEVTMAPTVVGNSAFVAGTTTATPQTSTQTVYDSAGASHVLTLTWTQTAGAAAATGTTAATGGTFKLDVAGTNTTPDPTATVTFNVNGTIQSITSAAGTTSTTGAEASFSTGSVGADTNAITFNLGQIGVATGSTTMDTSSSAVFTPGTTTQDGTSSGNFTGFTTESDGSIVAQFDNGQSQLIAKVPVATFADPNALKAQDGQAYTATSNSGVATVQLAGTNIAGTFETKSVEGSTTSLDTELTNLIVAQQAYGASAKLVTTADDMLNTALGMKQQ